MTVTAAQVRQARAVLGWTSPRLARAAKVRFDKVLKAQDDHGIQTVGPDLWAIRSALEKAGVRFTFDVDGRPAEFCSGECSMIGRPRRIDHIVPAGRASLLAIIAAL